MRVDVTLEYRFERTPDGSVWTASSFSLPFWSRYLDVFDGVRVVARAREVDSPSSHAARVDGPGVEVAPLPHYIGPIQFARRLVALRAAARAAIGPDSAVIMRVPSPIAALVEPQLHRQNRPYALEVVGDPDDAFAPGAARHVVRPLARRWLTGQLAARCRGADAVAYVTARRLQDRYPAGPGAYTAHFSSVDLGDESFVAGPRPAPKPGRSSRLVTVASLEQRYKGVDVLLDAMAAAMAAGWELSLRIVGDGRLRGELEQRARRLGLGDRVAFVGQVPGGNAVRAELDDADVFVLASRSEGLPRVVIEAMARGLPCIATTAGGIPELLDEADLVPPGDAPSLTAAITAMLGAPDRMAAASARNLDTAGQYRHDVLAARRRRFYVHVRSATNAWLEKKGLPSEPST